MGGVNKLFKPILAVFRYLATQSYELEVKVIRNLFLLACL